jgi:spore coat protein JC
MFVYEKKLQYPIRIKNTNPKLAAAIISSTAGLTVSWGPPCGI